ncbi:MAG: substrate-binding domain-containing protein [Chloroflexota bacterium]
MRIATSAKRLLALAATVAIGASACSTGGGGGKVALLLPEKQTARYEAADRPFFEAKFKELCPDQFKEYIYNNAAEDATAQQQQAEAAITNGAKVLVLDPVDGESAGKIVADAAAKGVKVISYDRLIKGGSKPDYYISFDNEGVGKLQGQALLDKLTADGKTNARVIWINGSPKDNNALLFAKGAHSVLDGKVQILKEDAMANWKSEEAQQIMEAAIAQFGKDGFDAVYVANDGGAGGVYAAMVANGVDPKTKPMTGQDAQLDAIQRIIAGQQYMTVYKAIQPEAEAAAQLACDLVQGKTPTVTTTPVNNGTADIPSILLTPVAVTADGSVPGTKSVADTVVKDKFYGPDTVAQICSGDYAQYCAALNIK